MIIKTLGDLKKLVNNIDSVFDKIPVDCYWDGMTNTYTKCNIRIEEIVDPDDTKKTDSLELIISGGIPV